MFRKSSNSALAARPVLFAFLAVASVLALTGCQQETPRVRTPATRTTTTSSHLYSAPDSPYFKERASAKVKVYQPRPQEAPSKPADATNDDRHPSTWSRKLKARYA